MKVRVHEHLYLLGKRDEMLSNNSSSLRFDSNLMKSLRDLRNGLGKSKGVDKKGTAVNNF